MIVEKRNKNDVVVGKSSQHYDLIKGSGTF